MRKFEGGKLVVASHNKGKIAEIAELIGPFGIEAKSAADFNLPEPEETGTTFEQNAYIKAFAAASATGLPALSDDSGLVVDALGGAPGVYTADWAETGNGRDFDMAMRKVEHLLQQEGATTPDKRTGRFVAVLCGPPPDSPHGSGGHRLVPGEVPCHSPSTSSACSIKSRARSMLRIPSSPRPCVAAGWGWRRTGGGCRPAPCSCWA